MMQPARARSASAPSTWTSDLAQRQIPAVQVERPADTDPRESRPFRAERLLRQFVTLHRASRILPRRSRQDGAPPSSRSKRFPTTIRHGGERTGLLLYPGLRNARVASAAAGIAPRQGRQDFVTETLAASAARLRPAQPGRAADRQAGSVPARLPQPAHEAGALSVSSTRRF